MSKLLIQQIFYLHYYHNFFFDMWKCGTFLNMSLGNLFITDNNCKLLITFQRVDVYLMNQSKLMNESNQSN